MKKGNKWLMKNICLYLLQPRFRSILNSFLVQKIKNVAIPNEVSSFPKESIFFFKENQKFPAPSLVLQYF